MNFVILRPSFIFTERKPLTSGFEFLEFASSPVNSKLTADLVAQCALNLTAELKDIVPVSLRWGDVAVRWVFEQDDILRILNKY